MRLARDNTAAVPGTRFIDPRVLARIGSLELVARSVVDGFISGLHRSPYLGLSIDFAEHRPYMPGDDIRRIDWRLYGRTDRLFVKEFEAETNANFTVLLDVSRSMDYAGGDGPTKLDYARFLAASLAYLSAQQRDRVGLATFDRDVVTLVPPSAKHFERVLHTLETARAERAGELAAPLRTVARNLRRRGIFALVSDLYVEPDALLEALAELVDRGHDLAVFHVLDPDEIELPGDGAQHFEDMEDGARAPTLPDEVRARYRDDVRAHVDTLRRRLGERGIDYAFVDTSQPLDHALFRYLSDRQRRTRVR